MRADQLSPQSDAEPGRQTAEQSIEAAVIRKHEVTTEDGGVYQVEDWGPGKRFKVYQPKGFGPQWELIGEYDRQAQVEEAIERAAQGSKIKDWKPIDP